MEIIRKEVLMMVKEINSESGITPEQVKSEISSRIGYFYHALLGQSNGVVEELGGRHKLRSIQTKSIVDMFDIANEYPDVTESLIDEYEAVRRSRSSILFI